MSGSYEIYIYSEYKDIYILEKILNLENPLNIYQFDTNSIFIKAGKQSEDLYQYSLNDYNLIKYKANINAELVKINNDLIISYKNEHFNNSFLNLLNYKILETKYSFKIQGTIRAIKSIENNAIMIGTDEKLYLLYLANNNIIILDKLFEERDYSYIDYINCFDEDTIIFGSYLFGMIYHFKKSK